MLQPETAATGDCRGRLRHLVVARCCSLWLRAKRSKCGQLTQPVPYLCVWLVIWFVGGYCQAHVGVERVSDL